MERLTTKDTLLGITAMLATLLIWSSFFISLRASSESDLTIGDIALLRFVPAALVFGYLSRHSLRKIQTTPKRYLLAIGWGAGLPFLMLAANGLHLAPVADGASLIPGILPLFVSSIAAFCYKERISASRKTGIGLIVVGISLFVTHSLFSGQTDVVQGHGLLLLASFSWAWFTVAMRVSGLTPVTGGLVLAGSACLLLPVFHGLSWVTFNLFSAPLSDIMVHLLIQGVAVGVLANFSYGFAISRLGAEMSAALGSFTPVVAALLAAAIFHEALSTTTLLAMSCIICGALAASELIPLKGKLKQPGWLNRLRWQR